MEKIMTLEDALLEIEKLRNDLQLAKSAIDIAGSIMGFSRGDSYERECTEKEYDEFLDICEKLDPTPPAPPEPAWVIRSTPKPEKIACPTCGKKVGGIAGLNAHNVAKHRVGLVPTTLSTIIHQTSNKD